MAEVEVLEAELRLRDEYTSELERIATRTRGFQRLAENVNPTVGVRVRNLSRLRRLRRQLSILRNSRNETRISVANRQALRNVFATRRELARLRARRIIISAKDKAKEVIRNIKGKLKNLVKKPWLVLIKAKDKATKVIKHLKKGLLALATGTTIGIGATLKDSATMQSQEITMKHFMGVGNEGKSKAEINKMTSDYIKELKNNANHTAYGTNEVIGTGTRALTISNGNTVEAMKLTKLAEDMAASDPNKNLGDAIEALADAKNGEFERMKEFGFKGSKEDFDKAGGDFFKMKGQDGKGLTETFGGLAAKHQNTAQGNLSTITGMLGSARTNLGKGLLEGINPSLAKLKDKLSKALGGDDMEGKTISMGEKIGKGLSGGIGKAIHFINYAKEYFMSIWDMISGSIDFEGIFQTIEPAVMKVIDIFKGFYDSVINKSSEAQAIFSLIGTGISLSANAMAKAFAFLAPIIATVAVTAFNLLGKAIIFLTPIFNALKPILIAIGRAFLFLAKLILGAVKNTIVTAINTAKTVFNTFKTVGEKACNGIKTAWNTFKSAITDGVDKVKTALNTLKKKWQDLKDFFANNPITQTINRVGEFFSGGGDEGPSHAVGLSYVPRNGYHARLHEGERVLTREENNRYKDGEGKSVTININGVTVREEADIDRIVDKIVRKIKDDK